MPTNRRPVGGTEERFRLGLSKGQWSAGYRVGQEAAGKGDEAEGKVKERVENVKDEGKEPKDKLT